MDGLTPHIDYRIANLRHEAGARRLAATAAGSIQPSEPHRGRRAKAFSAAALALAAVVASSGAYLAIASSAAPTPAAGVPPVVVDEMSATTPTAAGHGLVLRLPSAGGIRLHR